ncbi:unnamed protein product [Amoebophrya sp. A120]|nr:unnamed protein product [Amoebophrya sp. A120]|eukprot:GSA120T00000310001.1
MLMDVDPAEPDRSGSGRILGASITATPLAAAGAGERMKKTISTDDLHEVDQEVQLKTSSSSQDPQQVPVEPLPRWVLLLLGISGMIGYNVTAMCIPTMSDETFQKQTQWGDLVSLFRAVGNVIGAGWTFFCTRKELPLLLNWHIATTVQAGCYLVLAVLVAYANVLPRLAGLVVGDHDEQGTIAGASTTSTKSSTIRTIDLIAGSGFALILIAGIGSAVLNATMIGFVSRLKDPMGCYCFSVGQGLASLAIAILGFMVQSITNPWAPVGCFAFVAVFLFAGFALGLSFFLRNRVLQEYFDGSRRWLCGRRRKRGDTTCSRSTGKSKISGTSGRVFEITLTRDESETAAPLSSSPRAMKNREGGDPSTKLHFSPEVDIASDGDQEPEFLLDKNYTLRSRSRSESGCADHTEVPPLYENKTTSAGQLLDGGAEGTTITDREKATLLEKPALLRKDDEMSATSFHQNYDTLKNTADGTTRSVVANKPEDTTLETTEAASLEDQPRRSIWAIFCDASLLIFAKFFNMMVLMMVFPVLCSQTLPQLPSDLLFGSQTASSNGTNALQPQPATALTPEQQQQKQDLILSFKTRLIVTVALADVTGRALCSVIAKGCEYCFCCHDRKKRRDEDAGGNEEAIIDAPKCNSDEQEVDPLLVHRPPNFDLEAQQTRGGMRSSLDKQQQRLILQDDRAGSEDAPDLELGPEVVADMEIQDQDTANIEDKPPSAPSSSSTRPSLFYQLVLLSAALLRGIGFIPLLLHVRNTSRAQLEQQEAPAPEVLQLNSNDPVSTTTSDLDHNIFNQDWFKFAAFACFAVVGGALTSLTMMNIGKTVDRGSEKQLVGAMFSGAVVLGITTGQVFTRFPPFRL